MPEAAATYTPEEEELLQNLFPHGPLQDDKGRPITYAEFFTEAFARTEVADRVVQILLEHLKPKQIARIEKLQTKLASDLANLRATNP